MNLELRGDEMIDTVCPEDCGLCLKNCPANALDGKTVNQKKCRPVSNFVNKKGYVLKKCNICRRICPRAKGTAQERTSGDEF